MGKAISLHLLAVRGLESVTLNFTQNFTRQTVPMARTKQTKWRDESKGRKREPSIWGTAASGVTHRSPVLPARPGTSGNPSYLGMS